MRNYLFIIIPFIVGLIDLNNSKIDYDKIFITSAYRTAVASLGKSLKNTPADELGACVIKNVYLNQKLKKMT